ncbi:MAG: hypothetical protein HY211_03430 [Candidatus Omnitrophica bacterium]|nr:hypothetical protein [Candidatus Omnitrophota bacterium]
MKAEEYKEQKEQLSGWPVRIVSYKLGNIYHVSINNEEPGAWIVKGEGPSLAEAEAKARKEAAEALAKVKKNPPPTGCTSVPGF